MLSAALLLTLVEAVAAPSATAATGPSVPLPGTPSTPVTQQQPGERPQDEASEKALRGDQPPGSEPKDGAGTTKATSLSPSATWQVSAQTGDFTWTYPLRMPPAPGGSRPELELSYASSAVDGRTGATNNQASWLGDGWDLAPGFVERTYGGCAEDDMGGTTPPKTGDLCWRSDNAISAYNGGGGQLIRDDTNGEWRARNDDGSRIERLTGGGNGDDNGEHWKITTVGGTQYFFGSRAASKSTWTVPVFGDDAGEPCHASMFAASHCTQAWRWNLDKVVDGNGNVTLYTYDTETNSYGLNLKDTAVSYVRAGTLRTIEYGLRDDDASVPATARVDFATADRCVPGSDCTPSKKDNWPDVSWDDKCDTATCKDRYAPTFWSTKRLAKITTKVRNGSTYDDVDSWALNHEFPAPGDGEKAALWLKSITHTGHRGGELALPAVTFEGARMPNRVYRATDGYAPLNRFRITGVVSESGGVVSVKYAEPDCTADTVPTRPESNAKRCFPSRWAQKDHAERTDYFQKYVVEQVVQSDRIAGNAEQVTSYEYLDGAAWHYDQSEFVKDAKKTWNDFRGFGRVRTRTGKAGDLSGPVGMTERRFYRGMHGDKQPSGTRTASVPDSEGGSQEDSDWLPGHDQGDHHLRRRRGDEQGDRHAGLAGPHRDARHVQGVHRAAGRHADVHGARLGRVARHQYGVHLRRPGDRPANQRPGRRRHGHGRPVRHPHVRPQHRPLDPQSPEPHADCRRGVRRHAVVPRRRDRRHPRLLRRAGVRRAAHPRQRHQGRRGREVRRVRPGLRHHVDQPV